jgi:mono/diheme cytochrome c family protein
MHMHEYIFQSPEGAPKLSRPKKSLLYLAIGAAAFLLTFSFAARTVGNQETPVTAVEGESWIRHLKTSFSATSMGRTTWHLGPPPPARGEEAPPWQLKISPTYPGQSITLSGSDLYRLNCRGCHGELGHGAPPEIHSVIGPVQATSADATVERMKKAGQEMSRADAAAIAKESRKLLMQRLHNGGQHMPPPSLTDAEIPVLVAYLKQLSDIPGAATNQLAVKESAFRVGEHIVKSTCHVCHSATGPNPTPQQIFDGAIPPLSALSTRVGLPDFVRKVTSGAPIIMGTPPTAYRGRMSVFYYLTQDEAAAAYMYLSVYPPKP